MATETASLDLVREASTASGVSLYDIQQAAEVMKDKAHLTPVITSTLVNRSLSSCQTEFYFKCENFQRTGSFKFRGAYYAISSLQSGVTKGTSVVTHSSGNHAQAIAAAAALHDVRAHVVMPDNAAHVKVQAVKSYGGQITFCKPNSHDRMKTAEQVRKIERGTLVHPFENPYVVAGQGTIGLELIHQAHNLEAIIVPIGGGGLISGITIAVKSFDPSIVVIGAEPELACGAFQSFQKNERVPVSGASETVADGLKTGIGNLGWEVVSRLVDRIITVSEEEILQATKMVWEFMKIVIEPSSGVGVAAARSTEFRNLGFKRVGIILCGGNVNLDSLPWQK
ncbi:unnamed protein product [Agarophyton chilense]|eukprot:gb/GEZJ01005190.1/.p1 GENE.gb/GEZJ01005190.1/~~gb/GEZJ01005190.1/.p1  ORF type:complete len:339 (+),score=61.04 gb/GEZJ01005190.1/:99-1115(+)